MFGDEPASRIESLLYSKEDLHYNKDKHKMALDITSTNFRIGGSIGSAYSRHGSSISS